MKVNLGMNLIYAAKRWPEPEIWAQQVGERWGLKHVQFCFDVLDPRCTETAKSIMCDAIKKAVDKYDLQIQSAFIGGGAYAYNLLLHPMPEMRQDALRWCEMAAELSGKIGAITVGGPIAAVSVESMKDESKHAAMIDELVSSYRHFATYAAQCNQQYVIWEPTPIKREMSQTIKESLVLLERFNKDVPIPVKFCFDVGHQCSYNMGGDDLDIYKWIAALGKHCPVVHLQQTDGIMDRHWSFTKENNAKGIIKLDKILEALDKSGLKEVYLFPELIHPFEYDENKLLDELDESIAYIKTFI